jgi:hypothetical protein
LVVTDFVRKMELTIPPPLFLISVTVTETCRDIIPP